MKWLMLAAGGVTGTLCRYALSGWMYRVTGSQFPYGTMAVNMAGCFLLGFLAVLSEEKFVLSPEMRLLLMVGFCGAFTTFSTFVFETANLMKSGETLPAFANVLVSVVLGFILLKAGVMLGKLL